MKVKVHVWHTGSVLIDRSLAYKENTLHPMPYSGWLRGKSKQIEVPVSTYLIEHPRANILIDTGWHEQIRDAQRRHLGTLSYSMFRGALPSGASVRERLVDRGLKAEDLDYVILTHMHADHVSGVEHVKEAKNILTSEMEWEVAQKSIGYQKKMWDSVLINRFALESIPYGPYQKGLDLLGDGSIYLVHTPGHSEGLLSILVSTMAGWVLLASDVGYGQKSLSDGVLPGLTTDKLAAGRSLEWVRSFSNRGDCHSVCFNHDIEMREGIIQ
ncbi:N-acyl homoserine lactonase family protein [Halobacillus litoralis]|uniref:N-acyl homoserine lactonase family protein n=1 Tax=Halobacillus litoralis TaxID=45668 RepID=UPI001CD6E572|nr:N-acyl homoserine lactonase family protein [Halobacillus litoralis]MCA0972485.1 N-acyl homoserine lactonase family protein [Halobacillus litoralis]